MIFLDFVLFVLFPHQLQDLPDHDIAIAGVLDAKQSVIDCFEREPLQSEDHGVLRMDLEEVLQVPKHFLLVHLVQNILCELPVELIVSAFQQSSLGKNSLLFCNLIGLEKEVEIVKLLVFCVEGLEIGKKAQLCLIGLVEVEELV
jgi:hypothetical protein